MSYPERPLGEVLRIASASVPVVPEDEYEITGIYSFGRGLIRRPTIRGSDTAYKTLARIQRGQFAMSKLGAWEGALAVVTDDFDGTYVSPEYPVFDIDNNAADPAYIAHLARWPGLRDRLTTRGSPARRKRTTPARLLETTVPLPDLPEQRRVAARLDKAMTALAVADEKAEHARALRQALLESVIGAEQEQPPVRLGDVLALERIPVEPKPDVYYEQIGIRSFGKGIFHRDQVPGNELSKLKYFEVHPGRLIVSNIMAWEGAIALSGEAEKGCVGSSRFLSYVKTGDVDLRYLNYYFQSSAGRAMIRTTSTGTVLRNQTLSKKDFEGLRIPLPPLGRQQQIATALDTSNQIGVLSSERSNSTASLRLSLLNAAFSGEL